MEKKTVVRQECHFRRLWKEWRLVFVVWTVAGTIEEEGFRNNVEAVKTELC